MFRGVRTHVIVDSIGLCGFGLGFVGWVGGGLFGPEGIAVSVLAFALMSGLGAVLGFWIGLTRERCRAASEEAEAPR